MQVVLTVSASDSSGCAGMQADIRAIAASGAHAACVVTAVTAQSSQRVLDIFPLPAAILRTQLEVVFADLRVTAVKSGVLGSVEAVEALAHVLRAHPLPYVLDPVLSATSGGGLSSSEIVSAMRERLFPLATLITPNAIEAATLTGMAVRDRASAALAGRELVRSGCGAVLVKGGHFTDDACVDVLVDSLGETIFEGEFLLNPNTRGTGCTLASAIAVHLGNGAALTDAVERARAFVAGAIHGGYDVRGRGPVDAFAFMRKAAVQDEAGVGR